MATTASAIKNVAQEVEKSSRHGCFNLSPPVKLVYLPTKEIVSAVKVDIDGAYPNTVHTIEKGYWYPAEEFEIAPNQ